MADCAPATHNSRLGAALSEDTQSFVARDFLLHRGQPLEKWSFVRMRCEEEVFLLRRGGVGKFQQRMTHGQEE